MSHPHRPRPAAVNPTTLNPTTLNPTAAAAAPVPDVGAAALRASYRDPARVASVPAGPLFDVVSVSMDLGLDALDLLLRCGAPLGPVAADARTQVRRVGFLLAPGTLARLHGFAWWCREHGVRTASHGAVVVLPPLVADARARMQWLVSPDGAAGAATDPALLLGALRRALGRGRDLTPCQASAD